MTTATKPISLAEVRTAWADHLVKMRVPSDRKDSFIHFDAARAALVAKAKAKNETLLPGKRFNVFGKTNAAIAAFVGEGAALPSATAKTAAKPKGGTKGGRYQTSKTSSAIAQALAKKTGGDAATIEEELKGKIQKEIDKTRREAKKAGKEPTPKELRAAARAVVQTHVQGVKGKAKPEPTTAKAEPVPAKKAKQVKVEKAAKPEVEVKTEKKARSAKPKASEVVTEKPKAAPQNADEKAVDDFNRQKAKDIEAAIAQYKALGIPTKQLTNRDEASKTQKVLGEGISGIVYEHEGHAVKYSNHSLDSFGFEGMHAAAQLGIAPKVVAVDPAQSAFSMELLKGYKNGYSSEIIGSPENRKHTETFIAQLKKANERGFFVNDLHDENVMHNPQTGDVKFIDQGGFRKVSPKEIAGQVLDIDGSQNGGRPMAPRAIQTYIQTHGTAQQKRDYKKILKEYQDSIPETAEINAFLGKKTKLADHADLVKRFYALTEQIKANPAKNKK